MSEAPDPITERIIGAAIAVHRGLGPGLLESTYEECLTCEFETSGIVFERQVALPIVYRDRTLPKAYRLDFLVEGRVVIELKAVEKILPLHESQMLTYLKLSGLKVGLIINFNAVPLKSGIRRLNKNNSLVSPVSRC